MKSWDSHNWQLLLVFIYCVFLTYLTPGVVSKLGYLPLLYFAYRSKENAFWLVLLLIFTDKPAYFFEGGELEAFGSTPRYNVTSGITIAFTDLMLIVLIVKAIGRKTVIHYKSGMYLMLGVILVAVGVSFAYNMSSNTFVRTGRQFVYLSFIAVIPLLLRSTNEWLMFFKLLFPFIFLTLLDQVHIFLTGMPLAGYLNTNVQVYHAMREVEANTNEVSRALSGPAINFICFTGAMLLLSNYNLRRLFNSNYLYLVVFSAYLQIIMSATRGWFLSYTFVLVMFVVLSEGKQIINKSIPVIIALFILFALVINTSPVLRTQFTNAWARLSTVKYLAEGDLSARGTSSRISDRLPRMMDNIKESPVFGYGFSNDGNEKQDAHVGFLNPIIVFGIFGYAIMLGFIFSFMYKLYSEKNRIKNNNPHKKMLTVAVLSFWGLFIIHLTSRQIFGINVVQSYNLLIAFIFSISNWVLSENQFYKLTVRAL